MKSIEWEPLNEIHWNLLQATETSYKQLKSIEIRWNPLKSWPPIEIQEIRWNPLNEIHWMTSIEWNTLGEIHWLKPIE